MACCKSFTAGSASRQRCESYCPMKVAGADDEVTGGDIEPL
jgi:hypothetical protein